MDPEGFKQQVAGDIEMDDGDSSTSHTLPYIMVING
jgi:hypothetical protein